MSSPADADAACKRVVARRRWPARLVREQGPCAACALLLLLAGCARSHVRSSDGSEPSRGDLDRTAIPWNQWPRETLALPRVFVE